jgi:hypothetical protein
MTFTATTCAACGSACTDQHTIQRDGPGRGPIVAVCEACVPRSLADVWTDIAKRLEERHADHIC